jgi:hypothetical protein
VKSKRIWNTVFVVAAVATGVALSLKPWQVYAEQRTLANEKIAEMERAEASRTTLMEKKVRMTNSTGREEIARNYGYVRAGEQPLDTE